MTYKDIIGYLGTIFTIASFLPVILNIYRTKRTNNFPYKTLFLALMGNGLILVNGIISKNYVLMFMGTIFVIIYIFILFIKLNFKKKKILGK